MKESVKGDYGFPVSDLAFEWDSQHIWAFYEAVQWQLKLLSKSHLKGNLRRGLTVSSILILLSTEDKSPQFSQFSEFMTMTTYFGVTSAVLSVWVMTFMAQNYFITGM